jgi:hypothetical protein
VAVGETATAEATCPAGKVPIAGSAVFTGNGVALKESKAVASTPTEAGAWRIVATRVQTVGGTVGTIQAVVTCSLP